MIILIDLNYCQQHLSLLFTTILLQPQLILYLLQFQHDVSNLFTKMYLNIQQLFHQTIWRLSLLEILIQLKCQGPEVLVQFIAFITEVVEEGNELRHDVFDLIKGFLKLVDAFACILLPLFILFSVVNNRIRLPDLFESCFQIVDIVRFKFDDFKIDFPSINGTVSKGIEKLDRGRFSIFDEISQLLQDVVFIFNQGLPESRQIGVESLDHFLAFLSLGENLTHELPILGHLFLKVMLHLRDKARLVVNCWIFDDLAKRSIRFLNLSISLNQEISLLLQFLTMSFIFLDNFDYSGSDF